MSLAVQLLWTAIAAGGAAGLLLYLHQRHGVSVDPWLGPQLARVLSRTAVLDARLWLFAAAAYAYVLLLLFRVRKRLRQRDVGSHDRVAAV